MRPGADAEAAFFAFIGPLAGRSSSTKYLVTLAFEGSLLAIIETPGRPMNTNSSRDDCGNQWSGEYCSLVLNRIGACADLWEM